MVSLRLRSSIDIKPSNKTAISLFLILSLKISAQKNMEKIIIPMLRVGKSTALSRIPARVVFRMLQQPKSMPIRAAKAGFLFPVITAGVTFESKAETKDVTVATIKETIRN